MKGGKRGGGGAAERAVGDNWLGGVGGGGDVAVLAGRGAMVSVGWFEGRGGGLWVAWQGGSPPDTDGGDGGGAGAVTRS